MSNVITWFEIPVTDFDRANKFYSSLFAVETLHTEQFGPWKMGFFPMETQEGVGGAIVFGENCTPNAGGVLVYINAGEDLTEMMNRIEPAGGKVIKQKTLIKEDIGYFAMFMDTEGNKLALHSRK
jgi:predicted enzyme related to lactoylglutathione lyase